MIHSSSETDNTYQYHVDLLNNKDTVFDRANLGEIVYPTIYNREAKMNWDEQIDFMNMCMEKEVIYIIFYASDFKTLKDRLFNRGDTKQVLKNAEKINLAFRLLADQLSIFYPNVYALDITKVNDQIGFFKEILKEGTY